KLHEKAAALLKEWPEVVGFLRFEAGAAALPGDKSVAKKAKGWASGRRVLHLSHAAAWDAKTRIALDGEIEIGREHTWAPFAAALDHVV
ncbi:hypothetical protein, partial [Bacillus subtilis]|uniref:hypothetical protein n=1 Tax=Bacillus subtilis TaxID=1423 RepID=UPI003C20E42A